MVPRSGCKNIRAGQAGCSLAIPKGEHLALGSEEVEKARDARKQHALGDICRSRKRHHATWGLVADGMRVEVVQTGNDPLARRLDDTTGEICRR